MPKLTYGINVGLGTIGWCVLDEDAQGIVALNVRAFEVPQKPDSKESYAKARGMARRRRRTLARKRNVKMHAIKLLAGRGLLEPVLAPGGSVDFEKTALTLLQSKGDPDILALRARALDEVLDARQLSRLLYWFAGHRGYIPHGETSAKDAKEARAEGEEGSKNKDESKKVLAALAANEAAMESGGWRTVGEMLAARGSARNHGGDYSLCVSNEMIGDEVRAIFERQQSLGSPLFEGGRLDGLLDDFGRQCLHWLTPLDAQEARIYSKVSPCIYFGDEEGGSLKAAAKCCLSSELADALAALRHVRYSAPGQAASCLPDDVVETAMAVLFKTEPLEGDPRAGDKVTYRNLRKWAGLAPEEEFGVRKEAGEVYVPKAWRILRQNLSEGLLERLRGDVELADSVLSVLAYTSREETIREALEGERDLGICGVDPDGFDLSDEEIGEILGLPYSSRAFSGYGTRSARALRMLADELEDGAPSLYAAEEALGLYARRTSRATGAPGDFLPPFSQFDPACDNPVVCRAMAEARRVVNAMVREYGRPATIRLDWGRELGMPEAKRKEIESNNKKRERQRAKLPEKAAGIMGVPAEHVRNFDVLKLDLLSEQMGFDPITGERLDERRVLLEDGYAQVGHVLPYSRSMDDSHANKILCRAKTIQEKGDMTCYEWLGESPEYAAMAARLEGKAWRDALPKRKRDALLTKTFAERENDYINRNLNDDRYAAKRLREYLEGCLRLEEGGKGVVAIPGAIIPKLRFAWGFTPKQAYPEGCIMQSATDACVLAACTPQAARKAAWAASRDNFVPRETYRKLLADCAPWQGFAEEALELESHAIPSHAASHKLKAKLFDETFYGFDGVNEKGQGMIRCRGKAKGSGTYRLLPRYAVLPAGHSFLELWEDPEGKNKFKKTPGCLLPDPVFACDAKDWLDGTHVPRSGTQSDPWCAWKPIPDDILETPSLRLYPGDFLFVKGQPRVYCGFSVSTVNWTLSDPRYNRRHANGRVGMGDGLSLRSMNLDDIQVVNIGPLGIPEGIPGWPPEPKEEPAEDSDDAQAEGAGDKGAPEGAAEC